MSASSSVPSQPMLPRRVSAETVAGLRCSLVGETDGSMACPICSRVLRLPQLTDCCGNHFCTSCLSRWLQMSSSCPLCRQIGFKSIRDKKIERVVQDMEVYCHHEDLGCLWKGKLSDVDSHTTSSCLYVLVNCPNICGQTILRKELQEHVTDVCILRPTSCQYCALEGPLVFIKEDHQEECPKVPLDCPNGCSTGKFLREEIDSHIQQCPLEMIQCAFHRFGCDGLLKRKEAETHMTTSQTHHLMLTLEKVFEIEGKLEKCKGTMDEMRGKLETGKREFETFKNQSQASGSGGSVGSERDDSCGQQWSLHRQCERMLLMEKHLEASVSVCQRDPFLPVIVKMSDFSYYSSSNDPWYSHPFYSEPLGYKLCLCVYAGGICSGQGTHVSAYVHLMSGEFDENQEWPLELRFSIGLQNQLADTHHWVVDCEFKGSGSTHQISQRVTRGRARRGAGTATFIPQEKLGRDAAYSNCHYTRGDQLFFSVY